MFIAEKWQCGISMQLLLFQYLCINTHKFLALIVCPKFKEFPETPRNRLPMPFSEIYSYLVGW